MSPGGRKNEHKATGAMHWICLTFFAALLLSSCGSDEEPLPDISGVEVNVAIDRFEHDLQRAAADTTRDGATVLRKQYPVFFDSVWLEVMLPARVGKGYDSALVAAFAKQPVLSRLLDTVTQAFPVPAQSSSLWQADLEKSFRYAKVYFPNEPTPQVVTYVTEFGLGGFSYGRDLLGIGLDFYLGSNFRGYDPAVFPRYIQRTMNREHIASRAIEAWVGELLGEAPGERMLDRMIHNGKLLYIKDRLLPHVADTAVLGFGESALEWLTNNETQLWAHYLDEELLYETKPSRIGKLVGPSPNAPGMPPEAPGANANWVGMQIVQQYMQRRPDETLPDLLVERDAQRILAQSKYKPSR